MNLNYAEKESVMKLMFSKWQSPVGFRSSYKGIPITNYEEIKQFIDFTKYYVVFRGPRPHFNQSSTRKRDAKAFDVYQHSVYDTKRLRIEREAFQRGVEWAKNN
jgi:hypothetical protein